MYFISKTENIVQELKDDGEWFWSNRIVKEFKTTLQEELESSYKMIIDALLFISNEDIIEYLFLLPIEKRILIKNLMIFLNVSAETLDRAIMYMYHKKINELSTQDTLISFEKIGDSFSKNINNETISKGDDSLLRDILKVLCYASISLEFKNFYTFKNCNLYELTRNKATLKEHILYLGIRNSFQLKQVQSVNYGMQLERFIKEHLKHIMLSHNIEFTKDHRYKGQQFDLVLKKESKYLIIEIAFQETTGSLMERKSKQAKNGLFEMIERNGDKLVYITDGAGYFKRENVIKELSHYSHLICGLSEKQLNQLLQFISTYFLS